MASKRKKRAVNPHATMLYITAPERRALERLTSALNIRSHSGVVRHAIRKLAEANGVPVTG